MVKNRCLSNTLAKLCAIIVLSAGLASNASAAWFTVKVVQVVPRASGGDVFVQVSPGTGETAFTGVARGIIQGSDEGANKIMAVLLTAISMGAEVTIEMANPPQWNPAQIITSSGLKAP
jgi:hypothetical protein